MSLPPESQVNLELTFGTFATGRFALRATLPCCHSRIRTVLCSVVFARRFYVRVDSIPALVTESTAGSRECAHGTQDIRQEIGGA